MPPELLIWPLPENVKGWSVALKTMAAGLRTLATLTLPVLAPVMPSYCSPTCLRFLHTGVWPTATRPVRRRRRSRSGTITIDNSAIAVRSILLSQGTMFGSTYSAAPVLDSVIQDGAGPVHNALFFTPVLSGAAQITGQSTYAGGSIFAGAGLAGNYWDVTSSTTLGTGDVLLAPGAALRLGAASNLGAGAVVQMPGSASSAGSANVAMAALALTGAGINPASILTSNSGGVLGIDTTYGSPLNMASVGNGMMFLGSIAGGTYSAASLAPNSDGVYRLGGGGQLTVSQNVLTGGNNLIIGQPGGGSPGDGVPWGMALGQGNVKFTASQGLTGTITVNGGFTVTGLIDGVGGEAGMPAYPNTTAEAVLQSSGQPYGKGANTVALNGGNLQFDEPTSGGANTTASIGDLVLNGGPSTLSFINQDYGNIFTIGGPDGIVRNNNASLSIAAAGMGSATVGTRIMVSQSTGPGGIGNVIPAGNNATNGMATVGGVVAPWINYYYTNGAGGQFLAYTANGFVLTTYTVGGVAGSLSFASGSQMVNTVPSDIVEVQNTTASDSSLPAGDHAIYALRSAFRSATITSNGSGAANLIITSGGLSVMGGAPLVIGSTTAAAAVNVKFGGTTSTDGATTEAVIYSGQNNGLVLYNLVTASSLTAIGPGTLSLLNPGTNAIAGPVTIDNGTVVTGNDSSTNTTNGEFALGPGTGSNYVVLNGGEWIVNSDLAATITHNIRVGPAGGCALPFGNG
jgi:hypothetical protein